MGTVITVVTRVLKLSVVFWPFFISILFGGRPVKEVLAANRSFTILFMLLLTVSFTLVITTITLTSLRRDYIQIHSQWRELKVESTSLRMQNRQYSDRLEMCMSVPYDPTPTLERLDIYRGD